MDKIACCVLDKINSLAPLGRYVVISADEFFESFPEDTETDGATLRKALKALSSGGFIDLKYSDGEMFCTAPLKVYEPEVPATELEVTTPPTEKKRSGWLVYFLAAFAGGAAGSFIVSLIFALI